MPSDVAADASIRANPMAPETALVPSTVDEQEVSLYAERGFGRRQGPGKYLALVIVDLTYGFTDPESPLCCDSDGSTVAANVVLLEAARSVGCPVVFSTVIYDAATERVARNFMAKVPGELLRPGSRWVEIDRRIAPHADELVLVKLFPSAFTGTALAQALTAYRCDTVVVTGASTSGCVRATALDAMQHGYRVVVPREAVADRAAGPHESSLFDIDQKIGDVVSVEDTLVMFAAIGSDQ